MDPEYAVRYRELYEKHWWWRAREDFVFEKVQGLVPRGTPSAILDVGCGDGLFFERLSRLGPVEGIEMDPTGVTPGGRWAGQIHVQPFDETFRPARRYALVLLLDVLEHFPDPANRLRRALELVAPGGAVLVTVPAFSVLWTSHDELNRHFTRFTIGSLGRVASEAGARVESSEYFYHWMFPFKLLAHLGEGIRSPAPRPPRVPPRWINGFLYRLSRWEQRTFQGRHVPFGSSLVAVLRPAGQKG
jgi:SAM-dependent methyltransferase